MKIIVFVFILSILYLPLESVYSEDVVNPYDIDSEYEIDIFQNYFHPDWVFDWQRSENAFRTSGGSLNIRHVYHLQQAKFRFTLLKDTFWFRYRHKVIETIVFNDRRDEIELEYAPFRKVFLSLIMEPSFHKAEIDIGWAIAYGFDEAKKIRLEYHIIDFDKNYAFKDKSVDEGYEEFFNKGPREFKLQVNSIGKHIKTFLDASYQTPGKLRHIELEGTQEEYIKNFENWEIVSETVFSSGLLSVGLKAELRQAKEDRIHQPAVLADNKDVDKRRLVRPYILFTPEGKAEYLMGCSFIDSYGKKTFIMNQSSNEYFSMREILPHAFFYYPVYNNITLECGYMYDSLMQEKQSGTSSSKRKRCENRLRIAVEFLFSARMRMKIMTGWELDGEDVHGFSFFDGGYFQFQGVL